MAFTSGRNTARGSLPSALPLGRLSLCVRWNLGPMEEPRAGTGRTCSIITTSANALLSDIHDRMPVILRMKTMIRGFDPGFKQVDDILDLLKTIPKRIPCAATAVRSRVNSVRTMTLLARRNTFWRRCFSENSFRVAHPPERLDQSIQGRLN